ncbi:hyaluronidase PH-20-like [Salminus brasiliensis]|uniref:hyaluronidase PH-20-like n=1 Tax=Salminus brasiliensis TaxID=930266 RepID=UPI003B82DD5D
MVPISVGERKNKGFRQVQVIMRGRYKSSPRNSCSTFLQSSVLIRQKQNHSMMFFSRLFVKLMYVHYFWTVITASSLIPGIPFVFVWNAPSELCKSHFGFELDLSYFQIVSSTLKTATNQRVSIFYSDRFGVFPYVDEESGKHYGSGLPQLIDFHEHWELAEENIIFYIPKDQPGLAVLDFEEWRPQWVRNWGNKDVYREQSIKAIMQKNLSLTYKEAQALAVMAFEKAAKKYFLKSLNLGKKLRPSREWGYYLYPDCYNYGYKTNMDLYTGECPEIEKMRNNELLWLWNESTALFPSIYLELVLQESHQAKLYARHRIQEAIRVSKLSNKSSAVPVYAYVRPCFKDSDVHYLSEYDLVNTIGEAAALGAAGVISWGDMKMSKSEASCAAAKHHLQEVLNPYILNVTTATRLCSEALCQSTGRCVRRVWDSGEYLHLSPHRYQIYMDNTSGLFVKGQISQEDVEWFQERFDCACYTEDPCFAPLTLNSVSSFVYNEGFSLWHFIMPQWLAYALTVVWIAIIC